MIIPRHVAPRRHRVLGQWLTRVIVTVAALGAILTCQSLLTGPAGSAVSTAAAQHAVDHDVVCEPGAAAIAPATARAGTTTASGTTVSGGLRGMAVAAAALIPLARNSPAPTWAAQRPSQGRHRLLAIGIIRV